MEEFHHFSHDHPLTSFLNEGVDDYEIEVQEASLCGICGLPILSCPSYTCSIAGCKFFLHKPCAQLPQKLKNPRYHPIGKNKTHTLHLKQKSDSKCQNFTYKCHDCEVDVHPLFAVPVEIKSEHRSHPSHPLTAICREITSRCDACGEEHKGFFFSCQKCDFWIHQDCAVLPNVFETASHSEPLFLTYSLPNPHEARKSKCKICKKERISETGLYLCFHCRSFVHVSCGKSNVENLKFETRLEWIQLPAHEGDAFPSLVIRRFLESKPVLDDKKLTIEEYHKHPLDFHGHGFSSSNREECNLVCDVCVQPINNISSDPFYRCVDCHFLAHNICASRLPSSHILFEGSDDSVQSLFPNPSEYFFNSLFPCIFCHRPCNGFCYYVGDGSDRFFLDLECMTAPHSIKHASHGPHVLFRTIRQSKTIPLRCCPSHSLLYDVYRCVLCDDFYIHMRCALLPKRTRHKSHEHLLELITSSSNEQDQYNFCEFCEEKIDHKYWYYGCGECEQYFHINCIPSVGYLSKVKFGGTLDHNNIHHHPLTLTRMLTVERHEMCGSCNKIIKGFVDEMAFHCSECDYWIHFSCAWDSSGAANETSAQLRVYSKVQKDIEERLRNELRKENILI